MLFHKQITDFRPSAVLAMLQVVSRNAGIKNAVTTEASPQRDRASMTLHAPVSPPAAVSSVSPQCQHQLPPHAAHTPPGNHSLPMPLHATSDLAPARDTAHTSRHHSAGDQTSIHHECTGQQVLLAAAEDHQLPITGALASQQRPSPGETSDQMLHAAEIDSPVNAGTDPKDDAATASAAAAAESAKQAPGVATGTGRPDMQIIKSHAAANDAFPSAEQKCQASLPASVPRHNSGASVQQGLVSGFISGSGKQVTVTAQSKTRAEDILGHCIPAQTEAEESGVLARQGANVDKGSSLDHSKDSTLAAVAFGFTTAAGMPVSVTATAQAEARILFDSVAAEHNPAEPLPSLASALAASGFTTGTGKAVHMSPAAKARAEAMLADASTGADQATEAASQSPCTAAPALAPSGCSTGIGKAVHLSAAAKACAQAMLADNSIATQQAQLVPISKTVPTVEPSGFSTGTGKAVHLSAAAKARAAKMFAEDSTEAEQAEPVRPTTVAPTLAPSGFTTGTGGAVSLSTAAKARAAKMFAEDSTEAEQAEPERPSITAPTLAPSGFSTSSGKTVSLSATAKARAAKMLADDSTSTEPADLMPVSIAAATLAPSGFSTASGKPVHLSTEAKARAEAMFVDDSTEQAETMPPSTAAPAIVHSGFTSGTGKAVHLSAAAKARAEKVLANDSLATEQAEAMPPSTAAPVVAPSGFSTGTGKALHLSAAAQAQARSLFQDENAAPLRPAAITAACSSTPAGSSIRPGIKTGGVKPVLGTPRTGPTAAKPVMKRVKELSQSTGGKLFKKPRLSKIVSPFCPGATPNRVRPGCSSLSRRYSIYS